MRPTAIPETTNRGLEDIGRRFLANSPRGVWAGSFVHTRNCAIVPPAGSPSCGTTRRRPSSFIYSQRAHCSVGFTLFQFAGTRRSLRRSRQVVVPCRDLPHLRVRIDRRDGPLSAGSTAAASHRQLADLLLDTIWRGRSRSLIAKRIQNSEVSIQNGGSGPSVRILNPEFLNSVFLLA